MNVVIYARYSSHNQTEQSIEGQLKVCYEYAERNGYTVINEYIDRALTGKNANRPSFQKMIEDSNKKLFSAILVYQLDRFARNRYDSAKYKNRLKKNGVKVFSAKENIADDASGILVESVLEGMAEYYSAELSQKVIRGMKINAEKCLYNGGYVPLGYKIINKKYEIDENTSQIVKKIFDMYCNGYTITSIFKYLNENNIKNSENNDFNKNSIRMILKNKKYIGIYYNSFDNIEIKNGVPRIIDDKTFEIAQNILSKNKKTPAGAKADTEYLLTTKLFCGSCKEMLIGTSGTSHTNKVYYYYKCKGIKKHTCKRKPIAKDYIENVVIEKAKEILTDKYINEIAEEIIKYNEQQRDKSIVKKLEKTLKEIEKQKRNLLNSLKICNNDNLRNDIFQEFEKLDTKQQKTQNEIDIEKLKNNFDLDIDKIKFFLNSLKKGNMQDEKYKKLLIKVFINKVYLYNDYLYIIFNSANEKNSLKVPIIEEIESSFNGHLVSQKGIEPPTPGLEGPCSIQLSY